MIGRSIPAMTIAVLAASLACDRGAPTRPDPGHPQLTLTTEAAIPGDVKIAFARLSDIYGIREDGSGLVNLTDHPAIDDQPAWSPDGSKLAFRSTRDGDPEVYVTNADGSGITRLTFHTGLDGEPAWSPDGNKIAFRRSEFLTNFLGPDHPVGREPAPSEIWIMNADGTDPVNLTRVPKVRDQHPSWSPDGSFIVFERQRTESKRSDIWVMRADGTPVRNITPWGAEPQALDAVLLPVRAIDAEPAWSPDGETIVFRSIRDFFAYDIWTVTPDGKDLTELIELPRPQITPAWSPDGRKIIFADGPGNGLAVINRDGSGLTYLTTGTNESWPTWRR